MICGNGWHHDPTAHSKAIQSKTAARRRGQTLACNVGVHQIVPREGALPIGQRPSVFGFDLFLKFTHESLVVLYKQLIARG